MVLKQTDQRRRRQNCHHGGEENSRIERNPHTSFDERVSDTITVESVGNGTDTVSTRVASPSAAVSSSWRPGSTESPTKTSLETGTKARPLNHVRTRVESGKSDGNRTWTRREVGVGGSPAVSDNAKGFMA